MITFLRIHIKGFCSYEGECTVDLNQNQAVLIKAPNGSGKSTLFSAIVWALYGKTPKEVSEVNTWKRYQSKDYQGTLVELFFQKDDKVFKVVRCQNYSGRLDDGAKGKDRLIIYKDVDMVNLKGKVNLQNYLEYELGMSFKLFVNSIMFGQGLKRLINENNSDKKKIFEEVFDLGFVNMAKSIASKKRSEQSIKVGQLQTEISSKEKEVESLKEAYKDLKDRESSFKNNLKEERKKLKDKRAYLVKQLIEAKKSYSEEKVKLVNIKIKRTRKSIEDVKDKLADARNISNIPLLDVITLVIKFLEKGKVDKALNRMKSIRKACIDIDKLSDEKDSLNDDLRSLEERSRVISKALRRCDDLSDDIVEVNEKLAELKKKKLDILSPKYKAKYKKIQGEISSLKEKFKADKKFLDNLEWLLNDPLSNRGIKAFIFDSSIKLLNDTLDRYSKLLGFRISFEVDLDSTKKDFVTLIERDDNVIDYKELSGGEKQLCDVAMAFAMNESLTASKGINIAFLDEVFESLDSENIDLILTLINSIYEDKALFLITHQESLPLSNVKTLQVVKAQGRSSVKLL